MRTLRPRDVAAGLFVVMLIVPSIAQAQIVKHSGSLLDVDAEAGTIVLAEMSGGRLSTETSVIAVRTIAVTPDTEFRLARRVLDASGLVGDFVLEEVEPWAVYPGDFVTVECVSRDGRRVARRIVVVDTGAP